MSAQDEYSAMDAARQRLWELLHDHTNRLAYRKRIEIALEIVRQREREGQFPQLPYAFDHGVLSLPLTQFIEQQGKHGGLGTGKLPAESVARPMAAAGGHRWRLARAVSSDGSSFGKST